METKQHKPTLMQIQFKLPTKIIATIVIMVVLIAIVYFFKIPNPNMILIAGLVLCSALFGFGGGIIGTEKRRSSGRVYDPPSHRFLRLGTRRRFPLSRPPYC